MQSGPPQSHATGECPGGAIRGRCMGSDRPNLQASSRPIWSLCLKTISSLLNTESKAHCGLLLPSSAGLLFPLLSADTLCSRSTAHSFPECHAFTLPSLFVTCSLVNSWLRFLLIPQTESVLLCYLSTALYAYLVFKNKYVLKHRF